MTQEYLFDVLNRNKNIINCKWIRFDKHGFSRTCQFFVRGEVYAIEWWANMSYLSVDELIIPFESVELSGSWPNHFKVNLQFEYNGQCCAILPVEEY
jgi:hypothetical protein